MLHQITIAIPDLAGPAALDRTLAQLERHTPAIYEIVLLCEGEEASVCAGSTPTRRVVVPPPFGMPRAINRLIAATQTPFLLLLESGALVTPGWLERLLAQLAGPTTGLCGPSTNLSWNEQQVTTRPFGFDWGAAQAQSYAAEVAGRFGDTAIALDRLHSLADFCYLFKREVALQLGGFDESYGAGPCWEIDFNTRAARAGYQGIWVCGAYVHRQVPSPRAARALQERFAASKRLYQDRFCGLRLRGEKHSYEPGCRGEACEHFAPSGLIRISLAAPGEPAASRQPDLAGEPVLNPQSAAAALPEAERSLPATVAGPPLVTCIMPTRDRVELALQSIRYFQRQDYPNKELLILDDGAAELREQLAAGGSGADARIRHVRIQPGLRLGEKRNRAVELARGDIIAHWDDDDWYAGGRLTAQTAPLLRGEADLTGLEAGLFFELDSWRFWRCTPALHRRLFIGDVHGGTLVYRREVWGRLARYPDRAVAEDALFLHQAVTHGARLQKLPNDGLFIYLRHGSNAWAFAAGSYLDAGGWQAAEEPALLPEDRAFYAARSRAAPQVTGDDLPFVSCIMPTADRRDMVALALRYFAGQDYSRRELVVVDDGVEPVSDLISHDPRVRYTRLQQRQSVGAKRNLACEMARGELIVHWDDDDWMARDRLSRQVEALCRSQADVCGMDRIPYFEPAARRGWEYVYPQGGRAWVGGNTLCYRRDLWRRNPFPAVNVGEDNRFLWSGQSMRIQPVAGAAVLVGLIHPGNTSPKRTQDRRWRPYPLAVLQSLLGPDWGYYAQAQGREDPALAHR